VLDLVQLTFLSLVIGLCVTLLANLGTTIYLHRSLAHKALTLKTPLAFLCRLGLWLSTGIRPRQWVAVHRKHHVFTDQEGDPHSPVLLGWKKVQFMNVALYRRAAKDASTVARYARDIQQTKIDRLFFDHALLGLGLGLGSLIAIFGLRLGLVSAFVHLNLYLAGSAAVNALAHNFGRRPYVNRAGNLQLLALLTAGEGLHNNHHESPASARLSHRWYEIDFGWWVIRILSFVRLAKVRISRTNAV
jgi:stearoyl-CoA desaturase (delta-9 desaturase)